MQGYYYFKTLRKTIIQFLDVFNNIQIAKYNKDGSINKFIEVPLKYAPKQKFWSWAYDRRHEIHLPMMAGNITGIDSAIDTRLTNDTSTIQVSAGNTVISDYPMPTPYNVSFDLAITAEYSSEIDQIIEQILPFFNPAIFTTINIPEINNSFDVKIVLNSASLDESLEIPETDYRTINWVLSFTAHTLLFKPITDSKLIKEIYTPIFSSKETRELNRDTQTILVSGDKENNKTIYDYEEGL